MKAELISIPTDTVPLDGAYYEPQGRPAAGIILMHGNTMNFYVGAPRFLPEALVPKGYACLAYNRRGHDVLSTHASRELVGGAYQTIVQAVADNELAARWFARQGFPAPVVIGHSHGGLLAARHVADHPEIPALVLMSAHRGGPELMRGAARTGHFAADRIDEFIRLAEEMVAAGNGGDLLLMPGWYRVMSARTFLDAVNAMPSLVELAGRIKCPVLFIRGDREPADNYPAEAFSEASAGPCEIAVIADCDHFYGGCEAEIGALVAGFLARHL